MFAQSMLIQLAYFSDCFFYRLGLEINTFSILLLAFSLYYSLFYCACLPIPFTTCKYHIQFI
jgi:hypothetical protein